MGTVGAPMVNSVMLVVGILTSHYPVAKCSEWPKCSPLGWPLLWECPRPLCYVVTTRAMTGMAGGPQALVSQPSQEPCWGGSACLAPGCVNLWDSAWLQGQLRTPCGCSRVIPVPGSELFIHAYSGDT